MGEKKEIRVRLSTAIYLFIILVLVVALGIVYYCGFVKDDNTNADITEKSNIYLNQQATNKIETQTTVKNEVVDINAMPIDEATKTAQDIYSKVYDILEEGSGITDSNSVEITVGQEGTVGGTLKIKAYKLDLSKIEQYFTERAIKYIKTYYTDTPYGHSDGNYYIFLDENKYSYEKKGFLTTIFGTTDQNKRTLNVELYNNDTILAVSEKSSEIELDEYLVLKKVNNTWKIDMFEEF